MDKTSIYIVDDHPLLRTGLKHILLDYSGYEVVGEAGDGEKALEEIVARQPQIVITDINLPDESGIELAQDIADRCPGTRVVIYTVDCEEETAIRAFKAGAAAYVVKSGDCDEVTKAIDRVIRGKRYISPSIADVFLDSYIDNVKENSEAHHILSKREYEILRFVAKGLTSKEIANRLHISESTVKTHRNNIMKKLKINNMASLIRFAISKGLT